MWMSTSTVLLNFFAYAYLTLPLSVFHESTMSSPTRETFCHTQGRDKKTTSKRYLHPTPLP